MEEVGVGQRGDLLGPLRIALDMVAELTQLDKTFEFEALSMELKEIGRELTGSKVNVQSLTRPLVKLADPAVAREAHEIARVVDMVASKGQKRIRKLHRMLGVIQEGSEASSVKTRVATTQGLRRCARGDGDFLFRRRSSRDGQIQT
jgi:hypothetical protein